MATLQNLLPAPELGQLYASFDALKDNIEDWTVCEKFHFTVPMKDASGVIYKCKNNACDWRLRANRQDDYSIKIRVHARYYMLSIPALHFCTFDHPVCCNIQSVDKSLGKTVKPQPKWPKVPFVDTCIMALIL